MAYFLQQLINGATVGPFYRPVAVDDLFFDAKGDVVNPEYVWYMWKNGKYAEMDDALARRRSSGRRCPGGKVRRGIVRGP